MEPGGDPRSHTLAGGTWPWGRRESAQERGDPGARRTWAKPTLWSPRPESLELPSKWGSVATAPHSAGALAGFQGSRRLSPPHLPPPPPETKEAPRGRFRLVADPRTPARGRAGRTQPGGSRQVAEVDTGPPLGCSEGTGRIKTGGIRETEGSGPAGQ